MNPKVTIIVPCYNQAKFLPDALDSIIAQILTNWECIIINDGSPDNTQEIASAYAIKDSRIKLISQKNQGLAGARNTGIDAAQGDYIQFIDSDDLISPDKLSKQIEQLLRINDLALSYSDYHFYSEDNFLKRNISNNKFQQPRFLMEKPIYDIITRWETDFSIPIHCFLFDTRLFHNENIRFDIKLKNHEDWDCWMQIFSQNPMIFHIPKAMASYRLHSASMCGDINYRRAMWLGYKMALKKNIKRFKTNKKIHELLRCKLTEMKVCYQDVQRPQLFRKKINRYRAIKNNLYRTHIPWPIQKTINSFNKLWKQ